MRDAVTIDAVRTPLAEDTPDGADAGGMCEAGGTADATIVARLGR
jgi:hypothetical protein